MSAKRSPAKRRHNNSARKQGRALDTLAQEALECCAWIIARCGYSPRESALQFRRYCDEIPASVVRQGDAVTTQFDLAAHLLTLWSQDSKYLLPDGEMRPLSARGPAPSIEALLRVLDEKLSVEEVIDSLKASKALRRVGCKYIPRDSWVVAYPSNSRSQLAHHMRSLVEFLRTLEHNTRARNASERWFQYAALNPHLPARQLAALNLYLRRTGLAFLKDKDVVMHRMANSRNLRGSKIPVAIGVYLTGAPRPKYRRGARTGTKIMT
jgi:hypothetical protein